MKMNDVPQSEGSARQRKQATGNWNPGWDALAELDALAADAGADAIVKRIGDGAEGLVEAAAELEDREFVQQHFTYRREQRLLELGLRYLRFGVEAADAF